MRLELIEGARLRPLAPLAIRMAPKGTPMKAMQAKKKKGTPIKVMKAKTMTKPVKTTTPVPMQTTTTSPSPVIRHETRPTYHIGPNGGHWQLISVTECWQCVRNPRAAEAMKAMKAKKGAKKAS